MAFPFEVLVTLHVSPDTGCGVPFMDHDAVTSSFELLVGTAEPLSVHVYETIPFEVLWLCLNPTGNVSVMFDSFSPFVRTTRMVTLRRVIESTLEMFKLSLPDTS